jgi:hypothetical protein
MVSYLKMNCDRALDESAPSLHPKQLVQKGKTEKYAQLFLNVHRKHNKHLLECCDTVIENRLGGSHEPFSKE